MATKPNQRVIQMGGKHHGLSHLPEYHLWKDMKRRCNNPRFRQFKDYGGRGIQMDPEWEASFPAFLAAVGRRPSPELTLDRERNNEGYVPGNVRWATRVQQNSNRRSVKMVQVNGVPMPMAQASVALGGSSKLVRQRVKRGTKDLTLPINFHHHLIDLHGEKVTIAEAERRLGVASGTIKSRLLRGMDPAEAVTKPIGRWPSQMRTI